MSESHKIFNNFFISSKQKDNIKQIVKTVFTESLIEYR